MRYVFTLSKMIDVDKDKEMKNSVYQNILIHVSYMIEEEAKERAKKTAHDNDTYHGGLFSMLQTMHAV